ncbi:MAG: M17 family peptidase N-terminal domain-containing protein [Myxococcota bacterium]
MRTSALSCSLAGVDELVADTLVVCLTEDQRPLRGAPGFVDWRLCGRISRLLETGAFTGAKSEKLLLPTQGRLPTPRVVLLGWGRDDELGAKATRRMEAACNVLGDLQVKRVAIALPEPVRPLLPLVDQYLLGPLGSRLVGVFEPEELDTDG